MGILKNIFQTSRGSTAKIHVPSLSANETLKRYINTLDILNDKSQDFRQIVEHVLSNAETRKNFRQLDFGSPNDAYQLETYMETSLNALAMQLEDTIQKEFRCREEIIEQEYLFQDLTLLALTENQQEMLLKFEQLHQEDYLARATALREENIVSGYNSTGNILKSKHGVQPHKVQHEQDNLDLSELESENFKPVSLNQKKKHFNRKTREYPSESEFYMDDLQKSLDSIRNIKNGQGGSKELELTNSTSDNQINNSPTSKN